MLLTRSLTELNLNERDHWFLIRGCVALDGWESVIDFYEGGILMSYQSWDVM